MFGNNKRSFRLIDKKQGRVSASKFTATSLIVCKNGSVIVGTSDGQLSLSNPNSKSNDVVVVVLKSKRPVTRMIKISNDSSILALCGGEIFTLFLPSLEKQHITVFQTLHNVADICVNQRGPPDWGFCAITLDNRVHLFSRFSGQFEKLREFSFNSVGTMHMQSLWYENVLCIAGNAGVILLDDVTGKAKRVPLEVDTSVLVLPLPDGQILITTKGGLVGVFIDLNGQPVVEQNVLTWTSPPSQLLCTGPYIVTLFTLINRIDVALLSAPNEPVQRIVLTSCAPCLASANPYLIGELLYIQEDGELPCAFAVGLALQHSETPFRLSEPLPLKDRICQVFHSVNDQEEEEDELQPCRVACKKALGLVKDSFPPSAGDKVREFELLAFFQAGKLSLTTSSSVKEAFGYFMQAETSPLLFLSPTSSTEEDDDTIHLDNVDTIRAAIVEYTLQWRHTKSSDGKVDTALVQYMCQGDYHDGLESFCLDASNQCDFELSVDIMMRAGFELAAVHLRSMRATPKDEDEVEKVLDAYHALDKPELFCRFLLHIGSTSHDVISKHLSWILSRCEVAAVMNVLKVHINAVLSAAGEDTLDDVILHSNTTRPRYLLCIVAELRYQLNKASVQLLDKLARSIVFALEEAWEANDTTKELSDLFASIVAVDVAHTCLALMQASRFPFAKERTICFHVLGRHMDALRILMSNGDSIGAEEYCANVHTNTGDAAASSPDAYSCLLRIHLEQPNNSALALDFLSRHYREVNVLEAIRCLPDSVSLRDAQHFLHQALVNAMCAQRTYQVEKHLARGAHFRAKMKWMDLQRQAVVVKGNDWCFQCRERIVGVHLVRNPDGALKHVNCPIVKASTTGEMDDEVNWKHL